jgi:phage replication O-like protein O
MVGKKRGMANPQKEDGFVAIANEIMDALCRSHPGGSEGQVLWAIIRKTYGWNKQADKISISQLCEMTGLARRTIIYAMQNLEAKNMITIKRQDCEANTIALNKDYDKWVVQEMDGSARKSRSYRATIEKQKANYKNRGVVQEIEASARNAQRVVQENDLDRRFLAPTKDNTKDNITKYINNYVASDEALRLGDLLFSEIIKENTKSRLANLNTAAKEKTITGWALDIEKLIGIDKQEPSTVEEVIFFATHDDFWGANILSGKKLREKWDTLTMKMKQKGQKNGFTKPTGIEPFSDIPKALRGNW